MKSLAVSGAVALCCFMLWTPSLGFKYFQDRIPNGRRVQHPCIPLHLWYGVGHKNWEGGGARNAFGVDFQKANFTWDKCLCNQDSDGDGRTNGEELGDPDCRWKPGQAPDVIDGITNPGICEPLGDLNCKTVNDFDVCAAADFECEAIGDLGVQKLELRLPLTAVPTHSTTYYDNYLYMCYTFDLPDTDAQVIAWEPVIANLDVVHHIQVFGCMDENYTLSEPTVCDMGEMPCNRLVALWTLGTPGMCYDDGAGIRIGKNGITSFVYQVRWDNPEGRADYTDSSGIRFYYTENLRQNDLEMMMLGQMHLNIPPLQKAYQVQGKCGSKCTQEWGQALYVVGTSVLMHYHGSAAKMVLYRNGREVTTLLDIPELSYDGNNVRQFGRNPVQVLPGDEIVTTCTYDTRHKKTYTHYDWTPREEMCFAWITYYPGRLGLRRSCVSNGPTYNGCSAYPSASFGGCDDDAYLDSAQFTTDMAILKQSCATTECLPGCAVVVAQVRRQPCFQPVVSGFVLRTIRGLGPAGVDFSHRLYSCDYLSPTPPDDTNTPSSPRECFWNTTAPSGGTRAARHWMLLEVFSMFTMMLIATML